MNHELNFSSENSNNLFTPVFIVQGRYNPRGEWRRVGGGHSPALRGVIRIYSGRPQSAKKALKKRQ